MPRKCPQMRTYPLMTDQSCSNFPVFKHELLNYSSEFQIIIWRITCWEPGRGRIQFKQLWMVSKTEISIFIIKKHFKLVICFALNYLTPVMVTYESWGHKSDFFALYVRNVRTGKLCNRHIFCTRMLQKIYSPYELFAFVVEMQAIIIVNQEKTSISI